MTYILALSTLAVWTVLRRAPALAMLVVLAWVVVALYIIALLNA